jgi:hypothetical protein
MLEAKAIKFGSMEKSPQNLAPKRSIRFGSRVEVGSMKAHTAYSNTDYSRTGGLKPWWDGAFKGKVWVPNPTILGAIPRIME